MLLEGAGDRGSALATVVDGATRTDPVRARLRELRAVLDAFVDADGVDAIRWRGAEQTVFAVHRPRGTVVVDGAGEPVDGAFTVEPPDHAARYEGPPLADVLDRAGLDPSTPVAGVHKTVENGPGGVGVPRG